MLQTFTMPIYGLRQINTGFFCANICFGLTTQLLLMMSQRQQTNLPRLGMTATLLLIHSSSALPAVLSAR